MNHLAKVCRNRTNKIIPRTKRKPVNNLGAENTMEESINYVQSSPGDRLYESDYSSG